LPAGVLSSPEIEPTRPRPRGLDLRFTRSNQPRARPEIWTSRRALHFPSIGTNRTSH